VTNLAQLGTAWLIITAVSIREHVSASSEPVALPPRPALTVSKRTARAGAVTSRPRPL